jgi:hypothetical protein
MLIIPHPARRPASYCMLALKKPSKPADSSAISEKNAEVGRRDKSDCRFSLSATEYVRRSGIKRMSRTAK